VTTCTVNKQRAISRGSNTHSQQQQQQQQQPAAAAAARSTSEIQRHSSLLTSCYSSRSDSPHQALYAAMRAK